MGGISRRHVLGGAMVGVATGAAVQSAVLRAAAPVSVPDTPMRLVRRLERGLRGDAFLTVERTWLVTFGRQGSGITVTGKQVSATVEAPESLAPLAKMEQSRSTTGMFPILLTANGSIAATGPDISATDLVEAVRYAEREIANRQISPADQKAQLQHLAQLQRAAGSFLENLPRDLFYPIDQPSRAVREVALPDGLKGEFEVTYEARKSEDHGWLELAIRRVTTRIGESERRSREVWSMSET